MRPNAPRRRGKVPAGICVRRSEHAAFEAERRGHRQPPPQRHLFTSTHQSTGTPVCSWCYKEKP